jgi:glycosyltransferase involved in cell wall biosynthesis
MQLDPRVQRFLVGRYDACVFTTPGVLAAGLPARLKRSGRVGATVMIMWDFFPVANVEIGALSGRGSRLLHRLEQAVVRSADAVVLMTPRGEEHLDAYFTEVPGRRTVVPPWGADTAVAAHETPRRPRFTVVWGGQIVKGRALDDLLRAAADPDVMASGIDFVIAGDGPDRKKYLDLARALGIRNAEFLGHVPREEYARMLQECHVGASLLGEMSVPSFPSKTVDYCRAGLAILAAVESGTDFGTLLESAGAGVAVPSGDHKALVRALLDLAAPEHRKRTEAMGVASRLLFETELDVRVAASRFEELVTSMLGASDALPSRGTRP